jgi:hypothetical protein
VAGVGHVGVDLERKRSAFYDKYRLNRRS